MVVRQIKQFHRMVGRAGEDEAFTIVTVATRFVGKAIVPNLEAERVGLAVV